MITTEYLRRYASSAARLTCQTSTFADIENAALAMVKGEEVELSEEVMNEWTIILKQTMINDNFSLLVLLDYIANEVQNNVKPDDKFTIILNPYLVSINAKADKKE